MTIVTNTRRRPADDPSTALECNRGEDARLVQRINAAAAELHGLSSAGWQDVASFNGASFSSEFGATATSAHKAQAGLHLSRARSSDKLYGRLLIRVVVGLSLAGQGVQKLFGWFDGPGLQGTVAGFRRLPYRTPRLMAVAAGAEETTGYGPKGIEAIHDYIYELHEFDEFWSGS